MPQTTRLISRHIIFLFLIVFPTFAIAQRRRPAQGFRPRVPAAASTAKPEATPAEPPAAPQTNASARIVWEGTPKIARYRLQLARDEQFIDIVFDKLVLARDYTVTELPPGDYFWRVAPAASETGAYSKPLPVKIAVRAAGVPENVSQPPLNVLTPVDSVGWRTATGSIEQPLAAKLRTGAGMDLVGVNAYGMAYAVNGENGVALWSARYRPGAKKGEPTNSDGALPPFAPLLIKGKGETANVLVAFDSGVRALEGSSGKELWRAALPAEAMNGVEISSEKDASALAVFDNSRMLTFLKGDTGQIISQTKLDGFVVGRPAAFTLKNERGVLLAINNGTLDARNMAGESVLAIKLDSPLTTAPLLVRSPRGQLVMIGTESGLVALDAADLNPLWRVATEGDAPQGFLAAADLDNDGTDEVLMVTRRGRTVAVNVATGKIKWFAEGATDAATAAFADVNGDGIRDVLVAGGKDFALGFSGRDGALVWRADEAASRAAGEATAAPRSLVAVPSAGSSPALLVGVDPSRTGLRAVGLPAGAVK